MRRLILPFPPFEDRFLLLPTRARRRRRGFRNRGGLRELRPVEEELRVDDELRAVLVAMVGSVGGLHLACTSQLSRTNATEPFSYSL